MRGPGHIGVSGKAQKVLMKHLDFGSYRLEGNMHGEKLVPTAPLKKKKPNHAFCAFVEWAAYILSINKLNISEQVEQGRVQEIIQRE